MKKLVFICVVIIALVLLASCSVKQKLLGDWVSEDGSMSMTFNGDDTCKLALLGISAGQQTYKIKDKELIVSNTVMGISSDITMQFAFEEGGKKLKLTMMGQDLLFKRK